MSRDQQALGRGVLQSQDPEEWPDKEGRKEPQQRGQEHRTPSRSRKEEEEYVTVQGGEGVGIG